MLIRKRGIRTVEIVVHRSTQKEVVRAVQELEARGFECVKKIKQVARWKWEAVMKKTAE